MAPKTKGKQKVADSPITILKEVIPPPVATFDISDPSRLAQNYKEYITKIIELMKKDTDVKFTFVIDGQEIIVPVTPDADYTPSGVYVIRVTDGIKNVDFVGTKFQSWFWGIVTNNGRRFEKTSDQGHEGLKIMAGSESLHTDAMYDDLVGLNLELFQVGYQKLHSSFYTLVTLGEGPITKKEKECVGLFVVLLYEGPRFLPVFEMNLNTLILMNSTEVGKNNKNLIRSWCNISRDCYGVAKGVKSFVISEGTHQNIRKAATILRVMCRTEWNNWVKDSQGGGESSRGR